MEKINNLKNALKKIPGIGDKSAERIIYFLLSSNKDIAESLIHSIKDVMEGIKMCSKCGGLTETDPCEICTSSKRKDILMIVESARDIMIFEKGRKFNGKYHSIGGLINPLSGIMPENLRIKDILIRINDENIKEIIIALSPTTEGETTSTYLAKVLKDIKVKITRIAFGVPFGSDFDYVDDYTLSKSLDNRREIED